MALDPVVNFFQTEIATLPVASGGTSIVISTGDGAKLPDPAVDGAFNLTIYNESDPFALPEIVRVTAITGDTLTVTRAQEGTSATTKTAGSDWYVELTPTAKTIQDIDTAKLDVADVVNNLTSTDTDKALSANQGKVLQDGKEPADATILKEADVVDTLVSTSTTAPLSANQGKVLQDGKEPADATILKQANIVNNLTSTSTSAPLSANQGKVLQDGKLNLSGGTMTGPIDLTKTVVATTGVQDVSSLKVVSSGGLPDGTFGARILLFTQNQNGNQWPAGVAAINDAGGSNLSALALYTGIAGPTLAERMRITSAGNVGIGTTSPATKLDVSGAIRTSTGILFGADTAAANTLDDYEEGTWTPTASAFTGTLTSFTSNGTYVKIGSLVHARFRVVLTNIGTASGFLKVGSLPFTTENNIRPFTAIVREDNFTGVAYIGFAQSNDTELRVTTITNTDIEWETNYAYICSFTYKTA